MNKLPFMLLSFLLASCTTIDVEKKVRPAIESGFTENPSGTPPDKNSNLIVIPVEQEPLPAETVIIEKPVYVPEQKPVPPPAEGRAAVLAANRGIVQPKDYENAAMLYDFHRDFVYELYCRPLRVSDITLQAGEKTAEPPFISDSERWMVGAGVSYENGVPVQHIYIKPTLANLQATLIINTDIRVYHLILRSFSDVHMPIVRWRYHADALPQNYVSKALPASPSASGPGIAANNGNGEEDNAAYIDPRFLSFNYIIRHGIFRKPRWLPTLAYDDGKKTYISFPEEALQTEMPAVFEDRANVVNYRVMENVIVIDKLIEKVMIKLGDNEVMIEKKKGESK